MQQSVTLSSSNMELSELWTVAKKDISLLVLLGCANFMPIAARHLLGKKFATPVDMGKYWIDGRPLLGPHKTWRGLAASIAGTTILAPLLGVEALNGTLLALWSMGGDLLASFLKRRMNRPSGAKATGLDQVVESAMPLIIMKKRLGLAWFDVFVLVATFSLLEIWLSPILYRLKIRRRPY